MLVSFQFLFTLPKGDGYEFYLCQFCGKDVYFTPLAMYQVCFDWNIIMLKFNKIIVLKVQLPFPQWEGIFYIISLNPTQEWFL
jgi:hypothetical protein